VSKEETSFCLMETATSGHWLVHGLRSGGLPVDLIEACQAHSATKLRHDRTDANDARFLANIARTGFYRPVAVNCAEDLERALLLKARDQRVRQRYDPDNTIRGLPAGLAHRFAMDAGDGRRRQKPSRRNRQTDTRPTPICSVPAGISPGVDWLRYCRHDRFRLPYTTVAIREGG
jgi:transposase